MSYCEQCAALLRQNDLLANDRDGYVQVLTDENNKLRAEVERLTAERDRQYDQNAEQITRIAALEAENEKLRAALEPFANLTIKGDEPDVWAKKFPRFFELITTARAALEEKQ